MKRILLITVLFICSMTVVHAQIFYKVEEKGVTSPSYIFGSHHLSPIDIVEKSGAKEYFDSTEQVVGEIDLTMDPIKISLALQSHMMAPADSTLSILLKDEDMASLNAQFEKWSPMHGLTLEMLDPLKPMAVSTMIAVGISADVMPGYDPSMQLDRYFFEEGKKDGKNIIALESPDYQGEVLFDMTPLEIQAELLIDMLKNPEKTVESAKKLTKAYQEKDMNGMLELSKENDEHPEFMENILYKRNKEWMNKLPGILRDKPSFIVVGALHLAGPEGIIEGLREQGFEITPIY